MGLGFLCECKCAEIKYTEVKYLLSLKLVDFTSAHLNFVISAHLHFVISVLAVMEKWVVIFPHTHPSLRGDEK